MIALRSGAGRMRPWATGLAAVAVLTVASCAPKTAAPAAAPVAPGALRYPDYPKPDVPPVLRATPAVTAEHDQAWQRLQAGDLRGAERDFAQAANTSPGFYPAETGWGFALLAEKQYRQAAAKFGSAIGRNERYMPAWWGLAEAQLGLGNDAGALTALERVIAIDPSQEAVKSRIDLIKFRQVQGLIESGRKAADAGRLEEAQAVLDRALLYSPTSGVILRDLAHVELLRGAFESAEAHARRAVQADPEDAEAHAGLAAVLEARGDIAGAAAAYGTAGRLDPRAGWKDRADELRDKITTAGVPAEFKSLPTAATATRGQVAALIGMRLPGLLARAPASAGNIATDIRGHWAEVWILPVTQAGVMDVSPNHTFQPGGTLRRSDLASIVSSLVGLLGQPRATEVAAWKAAKPRFVDLPTGNVYYPAAALAVSSGAMKPLDGERFGTTRPATGADVIAAITRIEQLAPPAKR